MTDLQAFWHVAVEVLKVALAIAGIGLVVYLKYRNVRWLTDNRKQKADVQTLFDGKK